MWRLLRFQRVLKQLFVFRPERAAAGVRRLGSPGDTRILANCV
jgi:hypothetical protein